MSDFIDDIPFIGRLLLDGKVILCPTDTIWGLSCIASDASSVFKIYQIKKRNPKKPLILLVSNTEMLNRYITGIHPRVENLLGYYQRPLTVIHQASDFLPAHLLTPEKSIAIRVTKDETLKELIDLVDQPLVSTSANIEAQPSPTCYKDISPEIINQVDYVFRARRASISEHASTIIKYNEEGELFFLR